MYDNRTGNGGDLAQVVVVCGERKATFCDCYGGEETRKITVHQNQCDIDTIFVNL